MKSKYQLQEEAADRKKEHSELSTEQKLAKVLKRNTAKGGESKREVKRLQAALETATADPEKPKNG